MLHKKLLLLYKELWLMHTLAMLVGELRLMHAPRMLVAELQLGNSGELGLIYTLGYLLGSWG